MAERKSQDEYEDYREQSGWFDCDDDNRRYEQDAYDQQEYLARFLLGQEPARQCKRYVSEYSGNIWKIVKYYPRIVIQSRMKDSG